MGKNDKNETKKAPVSAPDKLVKKAKKGSIELSEEELKQVSGGLKIDYKTDWVS